MLEREVEAAPDFFRIYLGDGALDRDELAWLHDRRLRDLELADRILVPSEHIAETLARHGTARGKIRVVPYAADTRRFRPDPAKRHDASCTFLFAGGITQRKGIKYLLEAWRRVRRPGWRLQLLGPLPRDPGPLVDYLDEVEHLGGSRTPRCRRGWPSADVFVFPSLFEGSAVVTYEALACGLAEHRDPERRVGRPRRRRRVRGPGRRRRVARGRGMERPGRRSRAPRADVRSPRGRGPRPSTGRATTPP